MRYVKGTISYGLIFGGDAYDEDCYLRGYTDSDYAKCLDTRRSVSGYVFTFMGGPVDLRKFHSSDK